MPRFDGDGFHESEARCRAGPGASPARL
jgi:hypothetical protein